MATLHALFVGIDHYPNPSHVLRGCVNDAQHLHDYLEKYCRNTGLTFYPKVLLDADATRQAVIDAFGHFQQAEAADCCLFYYSGHGARSEAPEAFWGQEPDHTLESIVCWDSREPGGYDLMDKEISYLVWRASEGKELPFVTIMDCCHSGRMRAADVTGVRTLRDLGGALPPEQFLGVEHYAKTKTGQLNPPLGRRVHLAAARDTELAKEVLAGGQQRGIFTYCLVQALGATGPLISYAELASRVQLRVRANIADQSPQLETTFAADKNLTFLATAAATGTQHYLVSYDRNRGWTINAGAMQGLANEDNDASTLLEVPEGNRQLTILELGPVSARVEGMDGCDATRVYPAVVTRRGVPKLQLSIAPECDAEAAAAIRQFFDRENPNSVALSQVGGDSDFVVRSRDHALLLTRPHDERPLFEHPPGYDQTALKIFFNRIEKVANWHRLLELTNPTTSISREEIALELFRVTEPGNRTDDAPTEAVDWRSLATFPYAYGDGQWRQPAFQLKLRNTGQRTLWVSLLFLGHDFGISNQLLPKEALLPGAEAWARYVSGGRSLRTIPLQFDQPSREQGLPAIDEYLKLLVCTEEFSTDSFLQEGLSSSRELGLDMRKQPEQRDWRATEIMLRILDRPAVG